MTEHTPHTPTTNAIKESWQRGHPNPTTTDPAEREAEFDRWLTQHEAKVRKDYRGRIVDSLEDAKQYLDTADPFTDGAVTAFNELIRILDDIQGKAGDSFAILYR